MLGNVGVEKADGAVLLRVQVHVQTLRLGVRIPDSAHLHVTRNDHQTVSLLPPAQLLSEKNEIQPVDGIIVFDICMRKLLQASKDVGGRDQLLVALEVVRIGVEARIEDAHETTRGARDEHLFRDAVDEKQLTHSLLSQDNI